MDYGWRLLTQTLKQSNFCFQYKMNPHTVMIIHINKRKYLVLATTNNLARFSFTYINHVHNLKFVDKTRRKSVILKCE